MADEPAPSDEYVRNIVIIGRTGFGGVTIAEHIVGSTLEPVSSEEFYNIRGVDNIVYNFKIVELSSKALDDYNPQLYLPKFSTVHLVLFVSGKGVTKEDHKMFAKTLKRTEKCVSEISVLLLTGCEGKTKEAREEEVRKFRQSSEEVAALMGQNIHTVRFLNILNAPENARKDLKDDMEADEKMLREVVLKHSEPIQIGKMFEQVSSDMADSSSNAKLAQPKVQGTVPLEALKMNLQELEKQAQSHAKEAALAREQARKQEEVITNLAKDAEVIKEQVSKALKSLPQMKKRQEPTQKQDVPSSKTNTCSFQ